MRGPERLARRLMGCGSAGHTFVGIKNVKCRDCEEPFMGTLSVNSRLFDAEVRRRKMTVEQGAEISRSRLDVRMVTVVGGDVRIKNCEILGVVRKVSAGTVSLDGCSFRNGGFEDVRP